MYTRRPALGMLLSLGILARQEPATTVQVTGAIKQLLTLTADDQAKMPRASVKTAPLGETLRGKALAGYVVAEGQDGYQVVFSLGELDPAFIDNEIFLADTANGKPLFGARGRFRLVVRKDKPGARSLGMLTKLEVVQLRK